VTDAPDAKAAMTQTDPNAAAVTDAPDAKAAMTQTDPNAAAVTDTPGTKAAVTDAATTEAAVTDADAMTTASALCHRINAQQRNDERSSEYSVQDFLHFVLLQDSEHKLNEADSLTINASIAFFRTLPGRTSNHHP
jgi:hypothetical protein